MLCNSIPQKVIGFCKKSYKRERVAKLRGCMQLGGEGWGGEWAERKEGRKNPEQLPGTDQLVLDKFELIKF